MATDKKEAEGWADEFGFTGDERKKFLEIFGESAVEKANKSGMRLSDYSRNMDAATKAKTEYGEKMADIEAQLEAVGRLRTDTSAQVEAARKETEKLQRQAWQATEAVKRVALDAGLDPDEYIKTIGVEPVEKPADRSTPNRDDDGRFVKREDYGRDVHTIVRAQAELLKVNNAHRGLFGTDLPDPAELTDYVFAQGKKGRDLSIEQAWEEKYGVPAKRAEVAEAQITKRVEDEVQARLVKERSNMAMSQGKPTGEDWNSPVLKMAQDHGGKGGKLGVSQIALDAAARIREARARIITGQAG